MMLDFRQGKLNEAKVVNLVVLQKAIFPRMMQSRDTSLRQDELPCNILGNVGQVVIIGLGFQNLFKSIKRKRSDFLGQANSYNRV